MNPIQLLKRRIPGLVIMLFCGIPGYGQKFIAPLRDLPLDPPFASVQRILNAYYDTSYQGRGSDYKQWKRQEWWLSRHIGESGKVENIFRKNAEAMAEEANTSNAVLSANGSWAPIGPTSINNDEVELGRVVCIAFHPTLANTFYIGTPAGGLWKTTNGGSSYTPLTDHLPGLGVASILIHPTVPNIMLILTGDGNASYRGHYLKEAGTGIYKSYDGGVTWNETNFNWAYSQGIYGYKLLMHPTNPDIMYAATTHGLWRSTDQGINWTQRLAAEITDVELDPDNSTRIYACGYGSRFYYSSSSGASWDSTVIGNNPVDRMEIAVSAHAPSNVYVLQGPASANGQYRGFYRSQSHGIAGSWTMVHNSPNILGSATDGSDDGSQSWRNISLYVSPTNSQFVLGGSLFVWRSLNGGANFTRSPGVIHADNHFIVRHPMSTDLYSGCDGGLYKSTDGGVSWINLTAGLQITQYYRLAGTPQSFSKLLAGSQDNGQHLRNGTSSFRHVTCCDGMDNAISSVNGNIMYACTQNGSLRKATDGLNFSTDLVTQPTSGNDYWVTNLLLHPTRPDTIYFGGAGAIRRSYDGGTSWVSIGSNGEHFMAQGYSNVSRMYVANDLVTAGLTIQTTTTLHNTTPTWTTISGGANYPAAASGKFITGMAVNPNNSSELWFTLAGYFSGQKVYRTLDAGATWQNMSGSLPNLPVHCIAFEDNNGAPGGAVYIGTEMGVYYRDDVLNGWRRFGNNLPNSPVTDLYIFKNGTTNYISASTFGRGLWRSPLYEVCPANLLVSGVEWGHTVHQASNSVSSSNTVSGGVNTELFLRAGNYVDLTEGFNVEGADGELTVSINYCELQAAQAGRLQEMFGVENTDELVQAPFESVSTGSRKKLNNVFDINLQLAKEQRVLITLQNQKGETLATLHSGTVAAVKYHMGILKPKAGVGKLYVVVEGAGGRKRWVVK
jgi:hypothetical protein